MANGKSLAEEFNIQVEAHLDTEAYIFLVEDQQDLRLIVAHQLAKLGFPKVKQFKNGHEILSYMKAHSDIKPAVIICDKDMPIMGGYDFLFELRENPNCVRGAFAITLDQPGKDEIMLASENGVDGILVKPYSFKDIVPKLRQAHKVFNNPNNPEIVYELAKAEYRSKKWDRAEFIYKKLAEGADQSARPLVGLARIAMERKQPEQALTYLDEAEQRNPYYVHTFVERGRVLVQQQRIEEGLVQFKRAIELSPLNPVRYEEAAELFFRLQKYQEAVDLLNVAFEKELAFPRLHHYLSQAYFALKDFKKALRHIKAAVSQEPENVSYLNQLGICYKETGLFEDAAKIYNSIIKLDPDNRSALYNKAIMLAAKGQFDESIKLLKKCIEKHPGFEQGIRKLKEIEGKAGQKAAV